MSWKTFWTMICCVCLLLVIHSCRKKESGVCYCSYYSGDRTHYDLRHLPAQQRIDSCNQLDRNASHFAGSCKLKK